LKDVTPVITLTLLHPLQSVPVQSWPFETESLIRIGRSTDNEVILYSAVVSRHHVELRRNGSDWEIVSLGANGTYIDGKRITQVPVIDGMIIRLASSGPKIQIRIEGETSQGSLKASLGRRSVARVKGREDSKDTFINSKSTHVEDEN
jgi:pSer/pThr/pTyr-binding forkhead associated (FHA) protein